MPNYAKNKLYIFADTDEEVEEIFEYIKSDSNLFDFQKILPMPLDVVDWFQWRIQNWGTKANAHNCKRIGNHRINFTTAYWTADKILEKLSIEFPNVVFFVSFTIEGTDFKYSIIFMNGVVIKVK
jgi:hypothetical protein